MTLRYSILACSLILAGCGDEHRDPPPPAQLEDEPDVEVDHVEPFPEPDGPLADGTLGAWLEQAPMPTARAGHCVVAVGNQLVAIGGRYKPDPAGDFVRTDEIHAAQIDQLGAIESWELVGHTPSPMSDCTATARDTTITIVGSGWDDDKHAGWVWQAELAAGALSEWQTIGSLPDEFVAYSQHAWWMKDRIYVSDFRLPQSGDSGVVMHAQVINGALNAWQLDTWLDEFRGRPQQASNGEHLFVLGGYVSGNETVSTVSRSTILSTGAMTASTDMTPLPEPRNAGRAVVVDDHLFVIGGRDILIGNASNTVFSSAIDRDGNLLGFDAQKPLPIALTSAGAAVIGNHLFVVGGGSNGPGIDSVYAAQVRWEPSN